MFRTKSFTKTCSALKQLSVKDAVECFYSIHFLGAEAERPDQSRNLNPSADGFESYCAALK